MDREIPGEDAVRTGKRRLDVAEFHGELGEQVAVGAAMDGRRVRRERIAAIGDDRERFVGDIDQRRRVLGRVACRGNDHRHRLSDMDDLAVGEQRPVALLAVGRARQADDEAFRREMRAEIVERPDRADARRRLGRVLVDAGNPGMGQRAAQERRVQGFGQMDVVDEARPPAQQRRILDPRLSQFLLRAGPGCRERSACRNGRR